MIVQLALAVLPLQVRAPTVTFGIQRTARSRPDGVLIRFYRNGAQVGGVFGGFIGNYVPKWRAVCALGDWPQEHPAEVGWLLSVSPEHARPMLRTTADALAVSEDGRLVAEYRYRAATLTVRRISDGRRVLFQSADRLHRFGLASWDGMMGSEPGIVFSPDNNDVYVTFPERYRGQGIDVDSDVVQISLDGNATSRLLGRNVRPVGCCSGHIVLEHPDEVLLCAGRSFAMPEGSLASARGDSILVYTEPTADPNHSYLTVLDFKFRKKFPTFAIDRPQAPGESPMIPEALELISVTAPTSAHAVQSSR